MRQSAPNFCAGARMTDDTRTLHDPEAEEQLLASVLIGDAALAQRFVQDYRADLFDVPLHRDLAGAMVDLISNHADAEFTRPTWLYAHMAELVKLAEDRGRQIELDYLKQIRRNVSDSGTDPAGVYVLRIERLRDLAGRRELDRALVQLSNDIKSTDKPPDDIRTALIERLQSGTAQTPRMTILNMAALVKSEDIKREDLISGGILPMRGFLMIAGQPKVGKSILAMQLAAAVAAGKPFLHFQTKQRNVLLLSGEGGAPLLRERFLQMEQDTDLERIFAVCPDTGRQILLDDSADRARVVMEAKRRDVGLVVVDPLIRHHQKDENSTSAMVELMRNLGDVRLQTDAAMVVVHHTRKPGMNSRSGSGMEARGSSVLVGEYDSAMLLDKYEDGQVKLSFDLRWEAAPPAYRLELQTVGGLAFHTNGEWSRGNIKYTAQDILDAISESSAPVTYEDLHLRLGASRPTLRTHMSQLVKDGRVQETTGAGNVKYFHLADTARILQ